MKHRDIDALFKHGEMEQKKKLLRDSHKPDFLNGSLIESLRRIKDEVNELDNEMFHYAGGSSDLNMMMAEAADVANEAQIFIYKCKKELHLLGD